MFSGAGGGAGIIFERKLTMTEKATQEEDGMSTGEAQKRGVSRVEV